MQYPNVCEAIFQARPNRFIAHVELDGKIETVHVKNTGRCKELLLPGARVVLSTAGNPDRKTIENHVPSLTLMYRAAMGVYRAASWSGDIARSTRPARM